MKRSTQTLSVLLLSLGVCSCVTSQAQTTAAPTSATPAAAVAPIAAVPAALKPGELEGPITLVGSAPNARPIMDNQPDKNQVNFCPGPQNDAIRRFSGTIVRVNGTWSTSKNTKEKCFEIASFRVTQITKDRPAMTGHLKKEEAKYVLESDEGKRFVIESPTKGVRELAGKKVIADLVPASQTSDVKSSEATWKVVSYMEYPTP